MASLVSFSCPSDILRQGAEYKRCQDELRALRASVSEVLSDNERLERELRHARAVLSDRAELDRRTLAGAAGPDAGPVAQERMTLLNRENALLVDQQRALEGELQRLHASLEARPPTSRGEDRPRLDLSFSGTTLRALDC